MEKNSRPASKRLDDLTIVRTHVNTHCLVGFVPSTEWLRLTESRICPSCSISITSLSLNCWQCRKSETPILPPRAQHLPKLQHNHFLQQSLGVTPGALNAGLPSEPLASLQRSRVHLVPGQPCIKMDGACCSCGDTGCD